MVCVTTGVFVCAVNTQKRLAVVDVPLVCRKRSKHLHAFYFVYNLFALIFISISNMLTTYMLMIQRITWTLEINWNSIKFVPRFYFVGERTVRFDLCYPASSSIFPENSWIDNENSAVRSFVVNLFGWKHWSWMNQLFFNPGALNLPTTNTFY